MVAFLMSTRCTRADTPAARVNASPIESAKATDVLFDRIPAPNYSSSNQPIWKVVLSKRTKVSGSLFHPKAPNIHTRPKKKKSSWFKFGRK